MKYIKRFLLIVLATVLLLTVGFVIWAKMALPPQATALNALLSAGDISVRETADYIAFEPATLTPEIGLIFYPGGRVDYRAYAPVLRQIAAQGYLVVLVPVRLNLAFFDLEAAAPVLTDFSEIKTWVVAGHSLGGVAASIFAKNHSQIDGLILLASTPADDSLKTSSIPVLSITGSLDGIFVAEDIRASQALLPAESQFLLIEGGNHAQFGDYGFQPGDNPATITSADQWQQTTQAIDLFLQSLPR